mmetsp:Transcript_20373/g.30838  ORF Transcript_20373/g.30838 Transcript_20373/m.30838 type:complete len:336 (-) Transcript_20373:384-1391(-)
MELRMSKQEERIRLSKLLHLAQAMTKTGFISQTSKCFLKNAIVARNEKLLNLAGSLTKNLVIEDVIDELNGIIAARTKAEWAALYGECPLERAHLLASEDQKEAVDSELVKNLVYGEVDFDSFYEVLRHAAQGLSAAGQRGGEPGGGNGGIVFYDLGSGTGRAVFAAAMVLDLKYAAGIEILPRLHGASYEILEKYTRTLMRRISDPPLIKFFNGSFLDSEYDWTDGDLVFANSTCFEEALLDAVARRGEGPGGLRPGARVVTFTLALRSAWFRIIYKKRFNMSWGPATVYIHQKLSEEQYRQRLSQPTEYDDDQGISRAEILEQKVAAAEASDV